MSALLAAAPWQRRSPRGGLVLLCQVTHLTAISKIQINAPGGNVSSSSAAPGAGGWRCLGAGGDPADCCTRDALFHPSQHFPHQTRLILSAGPCSAGWSWRRIKSSSSNSNGPFSSFPSGKFTQEVGRGQGLGLPLQPGYSCEGSGGRTGQLSLPTGEGKVGSRQQKGVREKSVRGRSAVPQRREASVLNISGSEARSDFETKTRKQK